MKLKLGFSPCPNDTFMFDAMVHGKIDTEELEFELVMEDVEKLNQLAFAEKLDITKLSYHAYAYLTESYKLLDAGSALGNNCGPILIAKKHLTPIEINNALIGIPGKMTTANFLLSLAYPNATRKVELLFSDIEQALIDEKIDAGLIIHENRFTFQEKGLVKLLDCGEYWESTTQLPIPLGGIVVSSKLPKEIQQKVNRVMKRSVEFALKNPNASKTFVKEYAQEMEEEVMRKHIQLYVNEYSVSLGSDGKKAIETLFEEAKRKKIINNQNIDFFIH